MAAFEVLSLDPVTPQIRAPGAGDTYTFPRQALFLAGTVGAPGIAQTSDDNTGMWWPAADTLAWSTNGSERMRLDSAGNLGLGVTPSASTIAQFEGGSNLLLVGRGNAYLSNNATFNSSFKYINSAAAGQYNISGAEHRWLTAPSGTAGNAISFTQAMTLDASGNLGIGATSPARKLHIVDAAPLRMGQTADYFEFQQNNTNLWSWISNLSKIPLYMDGSSGSVIINDGSITTTATDGFLYVPGCAGTPTGTPTTYTGRVPIVVDTTNNKLYFYSGGQWRDAGP